LVARPALVGAEVPDAIDSAARDVTEAAATDAIEVEGLDAARVEGLGAIEVEGLDAVGVVAKDVGPPEAVAAGESPVQDEFVVARGGLAVGLAASEVAAEAGPDELRAEWGGPVVEPVWFQVESGGPVVDRGAFVVGPDGSPVAWGGWAELLGDCLDEPGAGLGG
jgi:hypothetical protein